MIGALSAVLSMLSSMACNGDAPKDNGPHKALYNRFIRRIRLYVFDRIFAAFGKEGSKLQPIIIDATRLEAHRTAASLLKKGCLRAYWAHQKWFEFKTSIVCDQDGKPICLLFSKGEMSDYKVAAVLLPVSPQARELIADKCYDAG